MMLERLGLLYRNIEQYDQAVDVFRQIAALDPDVAARAEAQIIDTLPNCEGISASAGGIGRRPEQISKRPHAPSLCAPSSGRHGPAGCGHGGVEEVDGW